MGMPTKEELEKFLERFFSLNLKEKMKTYIDAAREDADAASDSADDAQRAACNAIECLDRADEVIASAEDLIEEFDKKLHPEEQQEGANA